MNETNRSKFKLRAATLAVASCLSLSPLVAGAAGLGKLTVLSGLGQPLRAELDIGATKDELAGMNARLAPQDAFRQAGIEFTPSLLDLKFSIEKRGDGQSVVKVTSSRPINEPFLDFLVELNWPAGRLVREYTFLLDPPEIAARQSAKAVVDARVVETVRGGSVAEPRQAPVRTERPAPAPKVAAEPKPAPEKKPVAAGAEHVVQRGETLRKIATENQHEGVSLEQMLVGLFRANPDAFVGQNINRLKSGAILNIPDQATVAAVSDAEAKKVYVAHAGDWNAYRQKLAATAASMPAAAESSGQATSGKITARVEDKAAPAEQSKDQVKVARSDAGGKAGDSAAALAAAEADRVAKEKALKEAQDRLVSLEKNVNELQKLLEMKNQKLAELQQAPAAKAPAAEPPKPVEPPKPAEPIKAVEPPPAEAPKAAPEAKPAEAPKAAEPQKSVEPPKPVVAPVEPEEPGLVDSLLEDPLPLAGGAGILALLAGYFVVRNRRARTSTVQTTALPVHSSLGPNSVFRMTGGQSVDTTNSPPQTGEFSQTGPGTIDTDEVDPVAEADVYMAYGRDTQAEEILLEALQKDPQRTAIHVKLLEIYAGRRSIKQFETLAGELYALTGGAGADWEKVAAMGAALDPANPLYSRPQGESEVVDTAAPLAVGAMAVAAAMAEPAAPAEVPAPVVEAPESFERDTFVLPKVEEAAPAPVEDETPVAEPAFDADAMTLDFDLGDAPVEAAAPVAPEVREEVEPEPEMVDASDALDFDLGQVALAGTESEPVTGSASALESEIASSLDFDNDAEARQLLAEDSLAVPDFSPEGTLVMPSALDEADMADALGTWVSGEVVPGEIPAPTEPEALDVGFELDIGQPEASAEGTEAAAVADIPEELPALTSDADDDDKLMETVVASVPLEADDLDFDVKLTDSIVLGQPMPSPDFDMGSINLDLSAEPTPAEAPEMPAAGAVVEPAAAPASELDEAAHDERWEETNTKLDLARAYEEMGDLEGAKELLEEVAGEGIDDLAQQARTMLDRIAG